MIYCCGGYHSAKETIFLKPNSFYRDRKLEILICPNCGALIAELTQFNILKNSYELIRPKRKKTVKFIMSLEKNETELILNKVKYGTKSNMNWVYGFNTQNKTGEVLQYAKDFNGIKKLVKVM